MKFTVNILNRKADEGQPRTVQDGYDQRQGLIALYHKEMTDHFRSRRILIVLALIGLTSFPALYSQRKFHSILCIIYCPAGTVCRIGAGI